MAVLAILTAARADCTLLCVQNIIGLLSSRLDPLLIALHEASMRLPTTVFGLLLVCNATGCGSDPVAPASDRVDPCCTGAPPTGSSLQLEAVSATQVQGTVASPVSPVPTVIVKTPAGTPVAGIGVSFTLPLAQFHGSVLNARAVTNAQGIATPGQWMLGTRAGPQIVIATLLAEGQTRSITFQVQAAPAAPAQLSAYWSSAESQRGLPGWQINAPAIRLSDRFGNSVDRSGVPVSFVVTAGDGQLTKTEAYTDAWGYASAESWTLGPSVGLNSVVASAANLEGARFTAEALDVRELTWYDLDGVDNRSSGVSSGSIGLSKTGYFVVETFYSARDRRWLGGNYTISGTKPIFGKYAGTDGYPVGSDKNLVADDRLFMLWCPPGYDCGFAFPPAEEVRKYSKRK